MPPKKKPTKKPTFNVVKKLPKPMFSPEFYKLSSIPKAEKELEKLYADRTKIYNSDMKSLKEKYKTKANLLKAPEVLAIFKKEPFREPMIKKATKDKAFESVLNQLPSSPKLKKVQKEIDALEKTLITIKDKARPKKP